MMINTQLYEIARLREQEYLTAAQRRAGRGHNRLVAGVARRLRRRG
jgi:hypothetical protein